ncbi:MAG: Mut7-C RNAse domain-containing protein [Desulfovibrionaceae bacterium]
MTNSLATFIFHGTLRDFLAPGNRAGGAIAYPVVRRASIKDAIEALGPPHTEIGRIVVNAASVAFSHPLQPGEAIEVFPVATPCNPLAPDPPLRPEPLPRLAFLVDANVGKLAALLRLVGFDTVYDRDLDDQGIAALAAAQQRIVLTRDTALLKRRAITHAHYIRAAQPRDQLRETLGFFGLVPPYAPFSRCLACNTLLVPVAKADILPRLLPLTRQYVHDFHHCPQCDKIYWRGSHHAHMQRWLDGLAVHGAAP